ncbi:LAME_0C07316g1_1 [Lachancea meyersii CBS 8951]|uniref:LAME_0C07316g1_1 n=1 Tax=Lachancea meyersii CBS 8951 TaxID=1266667 RepID=A0A1G4J316_9SACH|nr:LAME_0C07316g1_1 [Lachancea meyersii CBS 8951]
MIKVHWKALKALQPARLIGSRRNLFSAKQIPSPKELRQFLDKYVIGQDVGKKVMSVAVYNHYLRVNDKQRRVEAKIQSDLLEKQRQDDDKDEPIYSGSTEAKSGYRQLRQRLSQNMGLEDDDLELSKSNVLMVGPSGSGKTLLASSLARVLDVPIAITDCTQLTQAGYIGEDVEVCINRLLVGADYDVAKAERGIIVLDEVDKLAKPAASIGTKDVSGEGVQQSLLKMLEGRSVEVVAKRPIKKNADAKENQTIAKKEETFVVDTSNILFILMGAFVGLDKHIVKRVNSAISGPEQSNTEDKKNEVNRLRFSSTIEKIELPNGKKTSALNLVTPTDLVSYGLIPELIGRVPIITALEPLERTDLYHILKECKNALVHQYEYIFKQFGVHLCVTEKALMKVASLAQDEGTGARGLRGIMERLLLNVNYECPGSGISYVLVDEKVVNSLKQSKHSLATHVAAKYYSRGEREQFIEDVYKEDVKKGKILDKIYGRTGTRILQGKKIHE